MSAEKAIYALLTGASGVTALAGTRIYPGELPQNTAMPALGVSHISGLELTTLSATGPYVLMQTRIEVTVLAQTYVSLKALLNAVRAACNYQRGTLNGVQVVSIIRGTVGPDMRDSGLTLFSQTIDFLVTWQEPNP